MAQMGRPPRPAADRFWEKVDKSGKCWLWTGTTIPEGYGRFRVGERKVLAHRWAWESIHGPVPGNEQVCHTCDNPTCVRPEHLWVGSQHDNMEDMRVKGRAVKPNAKLTPEIVAEIRRRYVSQNQLAREYGVSKKQISMIVNRKQWI